MTTKQARDITGWIIVAAVVILIAYDVVAVVLWGEPATISAVTRDTVLGHPVVAFAAGLLCGHLFWPQTISMRSGQWPTSKSRPPTI